MELLHHQRRGEAVVEMTRPLQGAIASQSRDTSPALPFAEVEVLPLEQVSVSAVVSNDHVLPAANVEQVVPSTSVSATAFVVPLGPPRREIMIPKRPRSFQGAPMKWFLRGQ